MKITGNSLLTGTSKIIEFTNNSIIAKEGPNMLSKMCLADIQIDYDSVFTTRQTLAPNGRDLPIMYGFLGTDITFLLIKPNYGGLNPMNCSGTTGYLEYYFEDDPLVRRTLTDILILSGDADHRIPQVYLYNPTDSIITIDIMAANVDENTISTSLTPGSTELKGLSYNTIQTDQIFSIYTGTGSTQFEIYDIAGNIQMVIPYNKIDIISINNQTLTVVTTSDDDIILNFLSNFNAQQAISRMNWAMENSIDRFATATSPGLDTTAPEITWNPYNIPQPMPYVNGVITKDALRNRFISSVVDYDDDNLIRDGIINVFDVDVLILNNNTGEQVSAITSDGTYSVTFTAKDLANNSTYSTKLVIADILPPTIYYNSGLTLDPQYKVLNPLTSMNLTADTSTPGTIYKDDIRRYYLNYIWDDVDGQIANSSLAVSISSGSTMYTEITVLGDFNLNFLVYDAAGNSSSGTTNLSVID